VVHPPSRIPRKREGGESRLVAIARRIPSLTRPFFLSLQHIIAHSLGSALVADILSDQSTSFPKLPSLPKQVLYETRDRFIFDTHSLFLVGSPLALFMHLRQAQLVPRRVSTHCPTPLLLNFAH
jgi:hypothetical protein